MALSPKIPLQRIVSGGQTGADRAGLDWAIYHGVPHGGWCPGGRRAEDGRIADRYLLKETPGQSKYHIRTRWNVRDSDGTVIITLREDLVGGSKLTQDFARELDKPCLHISQAATPHPGWALRDFVVQHNIHTLNVAGPRESTEADVASFVHEVLTQAFSLEDSLEVS